MKHCLIKLLCVVAFANASTAEPFELKDGDRVVFLGDTLIEREQTDGYIESLMTVQFPDRNYVFRNLGWSGDLPNGRSRASFDWNRPPDVWFQKLTNQVAMADPTVVFIGYGMAASYGGPAGVAPFKRDLNRLIDAIRSNEKQEVRFVLLSPIAHQNLEGSVTTGKSHNDDLKLYVNAIEEIATEQKARFVKLFNPVEKRAAKDQEFVETANGIHLTPFGYANVAEAVAAQLGWPAGNIRISIMPDGELRNGSYGGEVTDVTRTPEFATFNLKADRLPSPGITNSKGETVNGAQRIRLQYSQLDMGTYELVVDGKQVRSGTSEGWHASFEIAMGPDFHQAEALREAIIRKNKSYLYRWRPQNETYLFGFRKHEQGQNAAEVSRFEEDVAAADTVIAGLKKPQARKYELHRQRADVTWSKDTSADRQPIKLSSNLVTHRTDTSTTIPFEVAEGFEATLFAEDPLIAKPIQMNWDAAGNLVVASSETYPQIKPGGPANDKIVVLMDTDGDGRADSSRVLLDGLLIPTGIAPGDGGYYVAAGTQVLHLKDADHDYQVEDVEVVQSAFGTEDTHHLLHTLRWGMDGRLYFNQSIYIHSSIETPTEVVRLNSGGVFAYRTQTDELEIFLKGFCNPWGHVFDEYGQSFVTDGAGFQGVSWGVPQAMYFTYAGGRRILDSVSPGAYPKFAGLERIDTPNFPADWQGDLITCDFRAHRIVRFKLEEQGSGYVTREMPDLMRSTDVSFRPIDVKLGPDGALYIADWSNPIIQHGEVDFRDERRDKTSGRIWRIARKGGPVEKVINFQNLPTEQLLEKLNSPNAHLRTIASRVLTERREVIGHELTEWTARQNTELKKLRALWTYQAVDRINPPLLNELLEAEDGRVRAAATRVLAQWQEWLDGSGELLAARSRDEFPRVRVEAVRGLAYRPSAESAALVLAVADTPMDRFLNYAVWLSINDVADDWVAAIESGEWTPAGREKQLEFGLQSIEPEQASRIMAKLLPKKIPGDGSGPWIELIGSAGTVNELNRLLQQAVAGDFTPAALTRALNALDSAARLRNLKPAADRSRVAGFLKNTSADVRKAAVRLIGAWREPDVRFSELVAIVTTDKTGDEERVLVFDTMREIGGAQCVEALLPLTGASNSLRNRQLAVVALAGVDMNRAAPVVMEVLNSMESDDAALQVWRDILRKRGSAQVMASVVGKSRLNARAASAGLRAAREGGRDEPELLQALALISNSNTTADQELTAQEMKQLATRVMADGNPARGEKVYRRVELGCVSCHAIGGVGGKVGPDLTSMGASAQPDYLIESLLYPNRKIKEGYHSVIVETDGELEYSGILVSETGTELVVRNAANQEVSIPKNSIVKQTMGASLMPAGLVEQLSEQDRLDLFRFLAELGKPGAFDASKGNVARQWRLRPATHRDEQFGAGRNLAGLLDEPGWTSFATRVDGTLVEQQLRDALKVSNPNQANAMVGLWAAVPFESAPTGELTLNTSGLEGAQLWIDGQAVKAGPVIRHGAGAGEHYLLIKFPPQNLPGELRVSSENATFLVE